MLNHLLIMIEHICVPDHGILHCRYTFLSSIKNYFYVPCVLNSFVFRKPVGSQGFQIIIAFQLRIRFNRSVVGKNVSGREEKRVDVFDN